MLYQVALSSGDMVSYDDQTRELKVQGCPALLSEVLKLKKLSINPADWPYLDRDDHVAQLLNKFILKVQNKWQLPYLHQELCHCRQVPTDVVEELIVLGATTRQEVSQRSRAGTGCGSCQKDIERILNYYHQAMCSKTNPESI
jgi:bacterioferritin-associated ferredoxin